MPQPHSKLMNKIGLPFLRKFTFVFFDDILVYSLTLELHLHHLEQILLTLRKNQLYAKASKCVFTQNQVEYLVHVINKEGVGTDHGKVKAVQLHYCRLTLLLTVQNTPPLTVIRTVG